MNRAHLILIVLNALYLVPFIVTFSLEQNWEFIAYTGEVVGLLLLLMLTIKKTRFPVWLLSMLSIWGALHMMGGGIMIGGEVMYTYHFFHILGEGESYVFKYDQLMHFYGFMTATFVSYWLLLPHLKPEFRRGLIAFVAFLAGMGFGAINEMIEFGVTLVAPENGVGGYVNTSIDLLMNGLGALVAALVIAYSSLGTKKPLE